MQAIRAGTSIASELLGWSNTTGTVEAGKWADLGAVSGNPLKDITELQKVKFVMKGGVIFKNELRKSIGSGRVRDLHDSATPRHLACAVNPVYHFRFACLTVDSILTLYLL